MSPRPTIAAPNSAIVAGSGVTVAATPPDDGAPARRIGSDMLVPYWNDTLPSLSNEKPSGRPVKVKTIALRTNPPDPVMPPLPVATSSPAESRPYCNPPSPSGPARLLPGKLGWPRPLKAPVLINAAVPPCGTPAVVPEYPHSPPTTPPAGWPPTP